MESQVKISQFLDDGGRITQLPRKQKARIAVLKYLSDQFQPDRIYSEQQVNAICSQWHTFDDHILLRRELVDYHFLDRERDGSGYWRTACEPVTHIVILDGYTENPGDLSWDALSALGKLTVYDRTPPSDEAEIIRRIGDAQIVYTNKTPISDQVLNACPGIRMIGMLSTGYNTVDVAAAKSHGIPVTNIPSYGTAAVGQFAIAMLLEICHHIGHHDEAVHAGRWTSSQDWCFWDSPLIELAGKTMGIIGFGRIGQTTGSIAKALGMNVLAYDIGTTDSGRMIADYVALDTLLARSDVIALHCPLFPSTRGMINQASIAKMKDGVIILNNSRGPLIVEQDLADALNSGKVYAAGLDVVSTEPIQGDNPLLTAKNCIITPHISWAPKESRQRLMDIAAENCRAFLAGTPINVVNP